MNLQQRLLIFLVKRCFILLTTSYCFSLCSSQQLIGTACNGRHNYAHESECDKYYMCDNNKLSVVRNCSERTMFDPATEICIHRNESWCQAMGNFPKTSPTPANIDTASSGVLSSTLENIKSSQSTELSTGTASYEETTMKDTTKPTPTEGTAIPVTTTSAQRTTTTITISADTTLTLQDTMTTATTTANVTTVDASSTTASTDTSLSHTTTIDSDETMSHTSVLMDLSSGTSTSTSLFMPTNSSHSTTLDATSTDNVSHAGLSTLTAIGSSFHIPTFSSTTNTDTQSICIRPCVCGTKLEDTTLGEFMNKILTEMAVDRKNTSAYRRKYMSARDNRPSAQSIGSIGISVVVGLILLIILADLSRLCCKPTGKMKKIIYLNAQVM